MAKSTLKLSNLSDSAINRNFDAVDEGFADLERAPFSAAGQPTLYQLGTGANTVAHLLGRRPQGMAITSRNAAIDVYFDADATTTGDRTAVLQATGSVVVKVVWF